MLAGVRMEAPAHALGRGGAGGEPHRRGSAAVMGTGVLSLFLAGAPGGCLGGGQAEGGEDRRPGREHHTRGLTHHANGKTGDHAQDRVRAEHAAVEVESLELERDVPDYVEDPLARHRHVRVVLPLTHAQAEFRATVVPHAEVAGLGLVRGRGARRVEAHVAIRRGAARQSADPSSPQIPALDGGLHRRHPRRTARRRGGTTPFLRHLLRDGGHSAQGILAVGSHPSAAREFYQTPRARRVPKYGRTISARRASANDCRVAWVLER